jgi:hypothetical protein
LLWTVLPAACGQAGRIDACCAAPRCAPALATCRVGLLGLTAQPPALPRARPSGSRPATARPSSPPLGCGELSTGTSCLRPAGRTAWRSDRRNVLPGMGRWDRSRRPNPSLTGVCRGPVTSRTAIHQLPPRARYQRGRCQWQALTRQRQTGRMPLTPVATTRRSAARNSSARQMHTTILTRPPRVRVGCRFARTSPGRRPVGGPVSCGPC